MRSFWRRCVAEPQQVFRRLLECFLCWGVPTPRGNPAHAHIVLTQAGSNLIEGHASRTNWEIAFHAHECAHRHGLPIFPQYEVSELLPPRVLVVSTTEPQSNVALTSPEYLGSHGVAFLQAEYCMHNHWEKVVAITFVPHIWRVVWVYERLGLEVIIPHNLPLYQAEAMEQRHWSNPITAYTYELLARLYYLYKGYI